MNMDTANWDLIPEHCRAGLRRYIEEHQPVGGFLTAVLENDLKRAVRNADGVNRARIADYIVFLYTYAPVGCYGSKEIVSEWLGEKIDTPKSAADDALLEIQQKLDGVEWSHDTLSEIAQVLIRNGYRVRDMDDVDLEAA